MPRHKQWLSTKKQTGKKKAEVPKRSIKVCWLLIIDARCRLPRLPTNIFQVTSKTGTEGCNVDSH